MGKLPKPPKVEKNQAPLKPFKIAFLLFVTLKTVLKQHRKCGIRGKNTESPVPYT